MKVPTIKLKIDSLVSYAVLCLCFALLPTCGGGGGGSGQSGSGSVTVMLHVAKTSGVTLAQINCGETGVATIEAEIFDETNASIASGGPWACDLHQGTIANVPAGCGNTIVVRGLNVDGTVIYLGEVTDFCVIAGQDNNAMVELSPFEAPYGLYYYYLTECGGPECGFSLNWYGGWTRNIVQLTLFDDENYTSPLIDEFVSGGGFMNSYETTLNVSNSYRWRVVASDSARSTQLVSEEATIGF
ncbi:MAG TPA: hypothetical protein VMU60_01835 [Syntrophobacteria bacterium]|nr:hypothetical protein [Syntrophobacteria bacterium]